MCDGAHAKHNAATGDNVVRCSWHEGGLRSTPLQLIRRFCCVPTAPACCDDDHGGLALVRLIAPCYGRSRGSHLVSLPVCPPPCL